MMIVISTFPAISMMAKMTTGNNWVASRVTISDQNDKEDGEEED